MRIDLNWLAGELATLERDEETTGQRVVNALDWQATIHQRLQEAGDAAIANPGHAELDETATILVDAQYAVISELIELEHQRVRHEQIRGVITELAGRVGLTLADLEKLEHGHA